ncbi:MAG: hypothetical protein OZSIB_3862 [Candidatus Ozemobacter sibiricus]|uniref:Uncharacterized protein n=1 Tax=Candidatus Ozemobacter sibiricus TaxID=2268124 RepID=A0A367ZPG4_9BACT|nr:MAG: hypothetical protein OZSIB_3862 [Candidatus Ozemobacter sibiricus]
MSFIIPSTVRNGKFRPDPEGSLLLSTPHGHFRRAAPSPAGGPAWLENSSAVRDFFSDFGWKVPMIGLDSFQPSIWRQPWEATSGIHTCDGFCSWDWPCPASC